MFLNNNGPLSPYRLFCSLTGLELVQSSCSLSAPSFPKQTEAFKERGGDRDRGDFISHEDALETPDQIHFYLFLNAF